MSYTCGAATIATTGDGVEDVCRFRCKNPAKECCLDWWLAKAVGLILGGNPGLFLTLTIRWKKGQSQEHAARRLQKAWRNYRLWWNRTKPDKEIHCIQFWDFTEVGRPHLHLAVKGTFLPIWPLRAFMRAQIGSPQCEIEPFPPGRAGARYIAKYVRKSVYKLKGFSRYSRTHKWDERPPLEPVTPELKGCTPRLIDKTPAQWLHERLMQGCRIIKATRRGTLIRGPPYVLKAHLL